MALEINYLCVWGARMPSVLQMIGQSMSLKDIGKHYGCRPVTVGDALKRAGHKSIMYFKAELKAQAAK
tara:strand:- start:142 stop:345 length:204 start_codon:yes stop_codon:yes gene_type:complete